MAIVKLLFASLSMMVICFADIDRHPYGQVLAAPSLIIIRLRRYLL